MLSIAFIDTLGLCYDGSTLQKRGLGGSESAVILLSKELAKIGFKVTVFNDCTHDDTHPGVYDGVEYRPLQDVETATNCFDIVIGSRSVAAFAPFHMREQFKTFTQIPNFTNIIDKAKHKVLWMHDTFCDGDEYIESFLVNGLIDEVFTLSDWHNVYVTTCDHGRKRMFEVMKKHMFVTRNGIRKYHNWVDIKTKDPNLFVYNASVTKGMKPLVTKIWPEIIKQIPDAKLTIIGGYYRMRTDQSPDQQELEWWDMVNKNPHINFTGIIKQSEIADILTKASFTIYPTDFPETFGISSLESLAYNTPLLTCRFGALEETAIDGACYKIDYPVVPNGLFPFIDTDNQCKKFVDMVVSAYYNPYLHQQKMYACNAVKNICEWDSVALQWKQHFYKKLNQYLPVNEYRKVQDVNHQVRKVFGRRFINEEELTPLTNQQKNIGVITSFFNSQDYIEKCILSIAQQDYDNYKVYFIDDASTDDTFKVIVETLRQLPSNIRDKFNITCNRDNKGAVFNHFNIINEYKDETDFFIILDGDDWLVNNPNIFHFYNNIYHQGYEFTYGSCWSCVDNIPLIAQEYPPEIRKERAYRNYLFNWKMPYTHLRTFDSKLTVKLTSQDLLIEGNWPRAGGDTALFYYLIEQADPEKVLAVTDINYVYNDMNPINDYKINGELQNKTADYIIGKIT